MKWSDIKKEIEDQGINDESDIAYIDLNFWISKKNEIICEQYTITSDSWRIDLEDII